MRIHLLSDLHFEIWRDTTKFIQAIDSSNVDVLVLVGDIASAEFSDQLYEVFHEFHQKYPHVIYVPGNHEFYNNNPKQAWHNIKLASEAFINVHVLRQSKVTIQNIDFYGDTMWFRDDPSNAMWEDYIADFRCIEDIKPYIYRENGLFEHYLKGRLSKGDVVITHHLPSSKSTPPQFKRSEINRFFVCDMEDLILERQPKLWLHGHSHSDSDYMIGKTRVLCNARGYPRERKDFYKPILIEI